MGNMRGIGRGLAIPAGVAVAAAIFWAGGNSPAQAQGACVCPAGFTPIVIQNPASPLFNNRPDHMACSAGPGVQQACGSGLSPNILDAPDTPSKNKILSRLAKQANDSFYPQTEEAGSLYFKLKGLGLSEESINYLLPEGYGVERKRLGVGVVPGVVFGIDASAIGAVTRSGGYGLTDTAGVLALGAKTASFRETAGGSNIGTFWDVSGLLPGNQGLILRAFYGYADSRRTFGDAPDLGIVGLDIASIKQDTHTLGGSAHWGFDRFYVKGIASYDVGRASLTNNVDGSTGSYSTHGYATDLRIGHVFTLAEAITYTRPVGYTKAPPRPVPAYLIALDLSGHVGYSNGRAASFTDTAGFAYGDETLRYGDVGARAKLFALLPGYGLLWSPYVAATIDQQFGFSHTAAFPNQVQLVGGDVVTYSQAQTFWAVEGGVDVLNGGTNGWRVGAKGFYTASSDTNVTGGQLYLKIPLFQGPPVLR